MPDHLVVLTYREFASARTERHIADEDRALAEIRVREIADELQALMSRELLDDLGNARRTKALDAVFVAWATGNEALADSDDYRNANKPSILAAENTTLEDIQKATDGNFAAFVSCLVYADKLAGDYCDPRIS